MSIPRVELVSELKAALRRDELWLWYQPKVALPSRVTTGVEALVRWAHPRWGDISPSEFVPLAEQSNMADALTAWTLRQAVRQAGVWRQAGIYLNVAVNVSAISMADPKLPDLAETLCKAAGVPASSVTIEMTESASQDTTMLLQTVSRLRLKGFGVSLDDFGTGYSSLMQLKQLPFSELKIDRGFIQDGMQSADSRAIIRSTIDLAHDLALTVVAEGVEDEETVAMLEELGCDAMQGFLVSPALPGETVANWLLSPRHRLKNEVMAAPPAFEQFVRYAYSAGRIRRLSDWTKFS